MTANNPCCFLAAQLALCLPEPTATIPVEACPPQPRGCPLFTKVRLLLRYPACSGGELRPHIASLFSWATSQRSPIPPQPTPNAGSLSEQLLLLLTSPKTYAGALLHQSNTEQFYKKWKKLNQAGQAYLPQNRAEPSAGWEQGSCHAP